MAIVLTESALATSAIEYGLVEPCDIKDAVRIYVENFPHRVEKWFPIKEQGARFYFDLIDLMRLANGKTLFVARENHRCIGYLILTLPGATLLPALFKERFALRVLTNALSGRYGFFVSSIPRMMTALLTIPTSQVEKDLVDSPHLYLVAVDKDYAGRGVGSRLIEHALMYCRTRFRRMWLYVELDNLRAIELYKRFNFRIVSSDSFQYVMVTDTWS